MYTVCIPGTITCVFKFPGGTLVHSQSHLYQGSLDLQCVQNCLLYMYMCTYMYLLYTVQLGFFAGLKFHGSALSGINSRVLILTNLTSLLQPRYKHKVVSLPRPSPSLLDDVQCTYVACCSSFNTENEVLRPLVLNRKTSSVPWCSHTGITGCVLMQSHTTSTTSTIKRSTYVV